jgi:hypothetical protein
MSRQNRAAQFAPFAALTGFEDAIGEEGRLTERCIILADDALADLDLVINRLLGAGRSTTVRIKYFKPDMRKCGGAYLEVIDGIKSVDPIGRIIKMNSGISIPLDNVIEMESLNEP